MVFSAVSQPEAIMMKGWLSTFARFASQFDSDTLTTPTLRTSPEAGKPPSGKYLLGEGGQQTPSHTKSGA
jgi:hypothetical protein